MQEQILEGLLPSDIAINVIWLPVQPDDNLYIAFSYEESKKILSNPQTTHLWDESQDIGRWFKQNVLPEFCGDVVWDSYLLFGPNATWENSPAPLVATGFPVIRKVSDLLEQFSRLG